MADVKQIQQMIPLITCEIPFGQDVCELVFGVDVFDLDFWVQIDSLKQPINCNSVSPGNTCHRRTKYCPTSTTCINPASLQNLFNLFSGESDSIC